MRRLRPSRRVKRQDWYAHATVGADGAFLPGGSEALWKVRLKLIDELRIFGDGVAASVGVLRLCAPIALGGGSTHLGSSTGRYHLGSTKRLKCRRAPEVYPCPRRHVSL